jgi:hypothetical protein
MENKSIELKDYAQFKAIASAPGAYTGIELEGIRFRGVTFTFPEGKRSEWARAARQEAKEAISKMLSL